MTMEALLIACRAQGDIAQLARALRWQRRSPRFESAYLHQTGYDYRFQQRLNRGQCVPILAFLLFEKNRAALIRHRHPWFIEISAPSAHNKIHMTNEELFTDLKQFIEATMSQ